MGAPPNLDEILETLRRVGLEAGEMIVKGSEAARKPVASGVSIEQSNRSKIMRLPYARITLVLYDAGLQTAMDVDKDIDEAIERFVSQDLRMKYPNYKFMGLEWDANQPLTDETTFIYDPFRGYFFSPFHHHNRWR